MRLPDDVYVALLGAISTGIAESSRLLAIAIRLEDLEAEREYSRNINLLEEARRLLSVERHYFRDALPKT
ncbi:hypothetical protein ACO0LG_01760 [Undibacterium sp. Ji42W]|uniref:hypothetical protein n=1 Tax=Undibacterium sp. Ji42W TaxID=3413039 RepID=UPI003BF008AA